MRLLPQRIEREKPAGGRDPSLNVGAFALEREQPREDLQRALMQPLASLLSQSAKSRRED